MRQRKQQWQGTYRPEYEEEKRLIRLQAHPLRFVVVAYIEPLPAPIWVIYTYTYIYKWPIFIFRQLYIYNWRKFLNPACTSTVFFASFVFLLVHANRFYPLVYVGANLIGSINRVQNAIQPDQPFFFLYLLHALTSPMIGVLISLSLSPPPTFFVLVFFISSSSFLRSPQDSYKPVWHVLSSLLPCPSVYRMEFDVLGVLFDVQSFCHRCLSAGHKTAGACLSPHMLGHTSCSCCYSPQHQRVWIFRIMVVCWR